MGTTFSDAESALPESGGAQPTNQQKWCQCPAGEGGTDPQRLEPLSLQISLSKPPRRRGPPPSQPLGQAGPASLSPLPPPLPHALSASKISPGLSLSFKAIRTCPPASLPASRPSAQATPGSSLCSPNVQYIISSGICTCCSCSPDALPFHPPHVPLLFQSHSKFPSFRQYLWRATDVPGTVQGTYDSLNHPHPALHGSNTPSLISPAPTPPSSAPRISVSTCFLHWAGSSLRAGTGSGSLVGLGTHTCTLVQGGIAVDWLSECGPSFCFHLPPKTPASAHPSRDRCQYGALGWNPACSHPQLTERQRLPESLKGGSREVLRRGEQPPGHSILGLCGHNLKGMWAPDKQPPLSHILFARTS